MEWLSDAWNFLGDLMNPQTILNWGGIWLLAIVVFAETGLLVGFFLPGDALLFSAGVVVASPQNTDYPLWFVLLLVTAAAVIGDQVGYMIGRRGGAAMFNRKKESFFFRREYVTMTKTYFDKYGGLTLIVGRFLPIVRTFAPVLAGVAHLRYPKFLMYNVVGGVLWVCTLIPLGYVLGVAFAPVIEKYHTYIMVGFVVLAMTPVVLMITREMRKRRQRQRLIAEGLLNPEADADFQLEELKEKV
jgi:membrane-associated protein